MRNIFEGKEYPSVSVQTVLLISSLFSLEHGPPNIYIILCISTILLLFLLQALNPRFRYYFPENQFAEKETRDIDTYFLYGFTILSIELFLAGITKSLLKAAIITFVIVIPPYLWNRLILWRIRYRITRRLKEGYTEVSLPCPCCGGQAYLFKKVLEWNLGYEILECFGKCNRTIREGYNDKVRIG